MGLVEELLTGITYNLRGEIRFQLVFSVIRYN